jgi:hypothetical protein
VVFFLESLLFFVKFFRSLNFYDTYHMNYGQNKCITFMNASSAFATSSAACSCFLADATAQINSGYYRLKIYLLP